MAKGGIFGAIKRAYDQGRRDGGDVFDGLQAVLEDRQIKKDIAKGFKRTLEDIAERAKNLDEYGRFVKDKDLPTEDENAAAGGEECFGGDSSPYPASSPTIIPAEQQSDSVENHGGVSNHMDF